MMQSRTVAIDSVSESPVRHSACDAIVLIDVICDTTTLVTAAAQQRSVYPAASAPAALFLGRELREPLLAAEEDEAWRPGFELRNSPAGLVHRTDRRPFVLACGTGATLAANGLFWPEVYLVCLRNLTATARRLTLRHRRVLVLDAAHDGDIRCEDRLAAAHLVRSLVEAGFAADGLGTQETIDRWGSADVSLLSWGRSAEELRGQGRHEDLDFVLSHTDDLDVVCTYADGRLAVETPEEPVRDVSVIA
jgi:phosphosulfolactate phosphohydrolase-like enzyme